MGLFSIEIGGITELEFSYTVTNMMYGDVVYTLEKREEGYIAGYKPERVSEEDTRRTQVEQDFVLHLEELLRTCGVGKWDGFHKCDRHVLDGHTFTLSLRQDPGKKIYAHGYMKYPKGYRELKAGIAELYGEIFGEK